MKITFYRRDNSVVVRVTDKGSMIRMSTGIKIPQHLQFRDSRERFSGSTSDVDEYNRQIDHERERLTKLFTACNGNLQKLKDNYTVKTEVVIEEYNTSILSMLERYVSMAARGEIRTKKKTPFRESSLKVYRASSLAYREFVSTAGDLQLSDLNLLTKPTLQDKKAAANQLARQIDRFIEWMTDREMSINTRRDYVNIINIIMRYWAEDMFLQIPKIAVPEIYEPPIITIPNDFIGPFIKDTHGFYEKFSAKYKTVWEVSAMILITTLRANDALSLRPEDLQYIDGEMFLVKNNHKTGVDSTIPIPPQISDLLVQNISKYDRVFRERMRYDELTDLFPSFWAFYPELHNMVNYRRLDHAGRQMIVSEKMCDLIKPHMLRKTAITSMIASGVSVEHVRFASGHKSDAINRYIGWVDKVQKSEIRSHFQRILQ